MENSASTGLKNLLLINGIVAAVAGAALWVAPGRVLVLAGWVWETEMAPELILPGTLFVDSILVRFLGAAMLALALGTVWARQASSWQAIALLARVQAAFWTLGTVAIIYVLIRHDFAQGVGIRVVAALIWAGFALAWGWALRH